MDELLTRPATEAARLVRAGELSARELTRLLLDRIDKARRRRAKLKEIRKQVRRGTNAVGGESLIWSDSLIWADSLLWAD